MSNTSSKNYSLQLLIHAPLFLLSLQSFTYPKSNFDNIYSKTLIIIELARIICHFINILQTLYMKKNHTLKFV